jgi:hypothetical protein
MAEVFVTFSDPITGSDGRTYLGRVCGGQMDDGRWQGWIEFEATDGSPVLRSPRETTQPDRTDLAYWATGLTAVYLEGALERALNPGRVAPSVTAPVTPAFDGPLPSDPGEASEPPEAVLNPHSVFRKGEAVLRSQLEALAPWHLVNIIRAYDLSDQSDADLSRLNATELIELIVIGVRLNSPVSS